MVTLGPALQVLGQELQAGLVGCMDHEFVCTLGRDVEEVGCQGAEKDFRRRDCFDGRKHVGLEFGIFQSDALGFACLVDRGPLVVFAGRFFG